MNFWLCLLPFSIQSFTAWVQISDRYTTDWFDRNGEFSVCVFLQYLNLIITSELPATELEFLEDKDELSTINVSCFVDVQEWSLCDYVASVPYTESKVFSQKRNVNTKYPGISVGCCAVRRAGFFVWNVIVIMARISL